MKSFTFVVEDPKTHERYIDNDVLDKEFNNLFKRIEKLEKQKLDLFDMRYTLKLEEKKK